jgi:hypothetical protein
VPVGDWQPAEMDELLDLVLPADDKQAYERALVRFGAVYGKDAKWSLKHVEQQLQRICDGYITHNVTNAGRTPRAGLVWTYAELRCLAWASYPWECHAKEGGTKPTPEYLAGLLCRTVDEVHAKWYANPGDLPGLFDPNDF